MPPPPSGAAASATDTPRPILKLNTGGRQPSFNGDAPTPSSEKKTIKIKIASSQPGTPAAAPASRTPSHTKTKAGRSSKPTAKLIEAKKRSHDDSDDDRPMAASRPDSVRPSKMIKIKPSSTRTPTTPFGVSTPVSSIKFKPRGEPVEHHPGDAYDSEASDKETDPTREQTFLLRVMPGASAEYLKKALAEGTIGLSKAQGGADFGVQFIDAKDRRAFVTIDGNHYAAVLVNLPSITEAMKTWDRKNMMKNSDISQMLLCFAQVRNEHEARIAPLPPMVQKNEHKWPHGITPPMHDAVNRRFRRTITEKQWQSTASQVKKLIEEDNEADETIVEWLDDNEDAEYDEDEDAEGEADSYFPPQAGGQGEEMDIDADAEGDEDDDDLLAEMEAAMAAEDAAESEVPDGGTPAAALEAQTPMTVDVNTPAAGLDEAVSEEDEEDEEDISDEDEDDDDADDEKMAADRERKEKLLDLKNYEEQLRKAETDFVNMTNVMFKNRTKQRIESLKKEIAVKKAALGITEEE